MKIDFTQKSTMRGVVWIFFGIAGTICYIAGKDPGPLMTIAATMAVAHGVFRDDDK